MMPSTPLNMMSLGSTGSTPAATPLRQSKRKRAQVSYLDPFESESDVDSAYISGSDEEDWTSKKESSKTNSNKRVRKEKPTKPFPFLLLPPELRNRIYTLALVDPDAMCLTEAWNSYRRTVKRTCLDVTHQPSHPRYVGQANLFKGTVSGPPQGACETLSPALLATCKQIHCEAAQLLYGQPLHFADNHALHHFLAPLSPETTALTRAITVHQYISYGRGIKKAMNVSALTLLRSAKNLQTLRMEDSILNGYNYCGAPCPRKFGKSVARQIFRDASVWLDSVGVNRALQILDLVVDLPSEDLEPGIDGMEESRRVYEDELRELMNGDVAGKTRRKRRVL